MVSHHQDHPAAKAIRELAEANGVDSLSFAIGKGHGLREAYELCRMIHDVYGESQSSHDRTARAAVYCCMIGIENLAKPPV